MKNENFSIEQYILGTLSDIQERNKNIISMRDYKK